MSSAGSRRTNEHQAVYARQATILRKNLLEWDRMLRTPRGEDWPTMLGRLNAALNQTATLDKSIEDVMEHFVYQPKRATANPQDIPFFLSTRLEVPAGDETAEGDGDSAWGRQFQRDNDPVKYLTEYEQKTAKLAAQYEKNMVRF
jgi:hypothetical protein